MFHITLREHPKRGEHEENTSDEQPIAPFKRDQRLTSKHEERNRQREQGDRGAMRPDNTIHDKAAEQQKENCGKKHCIIRFNTCHDGKGSCYLKEDRRMRVIHVIITAYFIRGRVLHPALFFHIFRYGLMKKRIRSAVAIREIMAYSVSPGGTEAGD